MKDKYKNKKIVVVGNGFAALKEIQELIPHSKNITLFNPDPEPTSTLAQVLARYPFIKTKNNSDIREIVGTEEGQERKGVTSVKVYDKTNKQVYSVPADGVFVALGYEPATSLFEGALQLTDKKLIHIIDNAAATSVPGVFAAGDATDSRYRGQVILAAASGYVAAQEAEKYLNSPASLTDKSLVL